MLRYLPLIVKNGLRNRRRSTLTILSIAASLCLLGVLMALYHAFFFREATAEQALRLVTINRISLANVMPVSYAPLIRKVPGVREVMIIQWFGGSYKDSRDIKNFFARFAVEPDKLPAVYPEYRIPPDQYRAFLADRAGAIVGRPLAERLGFRIGDRVTIVGDIFPVTMEFTLRAIYDAPRDNENMFFQYEYFRESLPESRRDRVSSFAIQAESIDAVPSIMKAVDETFRGYPDQTKTDTERNFELSFLSYLGNVKLFLIAICSALTFTILLVSANTMAMSVRERVREIGILKTLGYTPGAILGILLGESLVIAIAGGFLGLALAAGVCEVLSHSPILFVDLKALHVPPPVALLGLGVAALIGLVSCIVPGWSASRRSIVESLRFSD